MNSHQLQQATRQMLLHTLIHTLIALSAPALFILTSLRGMLQAAVISKNQGMVYLRAPFGTLLYSLYLLRNENLK